MSATVITANTAPETTTNYIAIVHDVSIPFGGKMCKLNVSFKLVTQKAHVTVMRVFVVSVVWSSSLCNAAPKTTTNYIAIVHDVSIPFG